MFRPLRFALPAIVAVLIVTIAQSASAVQQYIADTSIQFTNPSSVNLLTRWNSNGSYGLSYTVSEGNAIAAIDYSAPGSGWSVGKPALNGSKNVTVRYTFDQPRTIDTFTTTWRAPDHSPDNYTVSDQSGTFVTDLVGGGRFPAGTITHNFAPRTSNYIEFQTVLDNTTTNSGDANFYHLMQNQGLGAFLAAGEPLAIDGHYDVFYEAHGRVGGDAKWTNHVMGTNGVKPLGTNGSVTYDLNRLYQIQGATLTHYDTGRFLSQAKIEVSSDGINYTTVFADANNEWHFRTEAPPRNLGYVVLDSPFDITFPTGRYVRLSWTNNLNPVEITEFQLFGVALVPVPEPSTLALLGLGGVGLAIRCRRRRKAAGA